MKFPFLFKLRETSPAASSTATTTTTGNAVASPLPWFTCANNPKTLSFRLTTTSHNDHNIIEENLPCFPEQTDNDDTVLHGLKSSDRLLFEPGETSSILEVAKTFIPYRESAAIMDVDSTDPFFDFRTSMTEMVEAHGLKDWARLDDLLTCYLRLNGKSNHGYIVGAFVDLLLHLALASDSGSSSNAIDYYSSSSTATTHYSFTSPLSFSSSTDSSATPRSDNGETVDQKHGDSISSRFSLG